MTTRRGRFARAWAKGAILALCTTVAFGSTWAKGGKDEGGTPDETLFKHEVVEGKEVIEVVPQGPRLPVSDSEFDRFQILKSQAAEGGVSCVATSHDSPLIVAGANTPAPGVTAMLAPPTNDDCASAVTIVQGTSCSATAGTSAEATQTIAPSTCTGFTSSAALDVWYKFVATTTNPTIQVTGTGGFDSIVELRSGACNGTAVSCSDATTANGVESIAATGLTIGNTYLVRVYGWAATTPTGTFNVCAFAPQPPANDTCASPTALTLDIPAAGTNAIAANNYALQTTPTACYTGDGEIGQTTTLTGTGRDTVWSFTAPSAGLYSFRARNDAAGGNLLLYTKTTCPAAPSTAIACDGTVKAANRNSNTAQYTAAEEVACKAMAAGETRYLFVDEGAVTTTGGAYTVEVNKCTLDPDLGESPATASTLACGIEGSIKAGTTPRDQDFFGLGAPASGSRVFAIVDSVSGNSTDSDLRVTTDTDTLEYDDGDNTTPWGSIAPNISGRPTTGATSYLEVTHFTAGSATEPYRLYAVVQPPGGGLGGSSATPESEPNEATLAQANMAANNFFSGAIPVGGTTGDFDLFAFGVNAGDLIQLNVDGDPLHNATPVDFAFFLFDKNGAQILGFTDGTSTSSNTASPGTLLGTTPTSPGESGTYRARYSGVYYAAVNTQSAAQTGDYLYSIGINCLTGTQLSSDLSVTKIGPASAAANSDVAYTITANNAGPNAATGVSFTDTFPAGATFVSLTGPTGWTCQLVPGGISCTNQALGSGIPQVFTLTLHIPQCFGNNDATNTVSITSLTSDSNNANNTASAVTSIIDPLTCSDGNACTDNDTCVAGACVGGAPPSCTDGDVCTTDSCNAATGLCEHAPLVCNDNNSCTDDTCVGPTTGCVYTPNDNNACSDGSLCTATDTCVNGTCVGSNPTACDDANQCTTDTCDPATGACVFTNNTISCDDGDACTTNDACGPRFAESFDDVDAPGLPEGWTATLQQGQAADPAWYTDVVTPDSPPNTAYAEEPAHVTDNTLDSPVIAIASASAKLTFKNRYSYESTFDGGVLEISIGGGAFTDIVTAGGSFASGGYTGLISTAWMSPIGGRNAWTGNSTAYPAYINTVVNLPAAAAGQNIVLRWRATSDQSLAGTGQDIDSVTIGDPGNVCSGAAVNCDDFNPCTDDSCDPQTGCVHVNTTGGCDDGNLCTTDEQCNAGSCGGGTPTVCNDGNVCTDEVCDPQSGACVPSANSAPCDDGNPCTAGDTCGLGSCQPGTPITAPGEVTGVSAPDKNTYTWAAPLYATQYDVVRGSVGSLPTGPGGGDEVCFGDLGSASLSDVSTPASGSSFFYLVRGENTCGTGSYGTQSNGSPRVTTTCP
jgi:uncharacterized repeat protein (TIGR01451 family)